MEQQLMNYLTDKLDIDYYDTLVEIQRESQRQKVKGGNELTEREKNQSRNDMVQDYIEDVLDYVGVDDEVLDEAVKGDDKIDFWNGKNKDGNYYCDLVSEYADNQVSIYNYDLANEAPIFNNYIEEALEEYGYNKDRGLMGVYQMGQYRFYGDFASSLLSLVDDFVKEQRKEKK